MSSRVLLRGVLAAFKEELPAYLCRDLDGGERAVCSSRIRKLFDYTVGGGKLARSCLTVDAYKLLLNSKASQEQLHSTSQVAATMELLQSFFLIIDDIIDQSKLRRGRKCWHTLPEIGLAAINDGLLLDCSIDCITRKAIPQHPKLDDILRSIYETKQKTIIGQILDCDTKRAEDITWQRYRQVAEHKTSHYTYYLPLALGYHLANVHFDESTIRKLAYRIGYLFQAHDDFLDCFASPEASGKSSCDLSEGKCTWITCRLFEKMDNDKRVSFLQHFGKEENEHVDAARAIINEHSIREDFERFLAGEAADIHEVINGSRDITPRLRPLLHSIVDEIGGESETKP